jgi:hypothetical protein
MVSAPIKGFRLQTFFATRLFDILLNVGAINLFPPATEHYEGVKP